MNFPDSIEEHVLNFSENGISWDSIETIFAENSFYVFSEMRNTFQSPVFHGEGDVFTHTQMVCNELVKIPDFITLPSRQRVELFLAALLHDIGKVKTTRVENEVFISPHHSSAGSHIVREFLWKKCSLCGTHEKQSFRETVCNLVRYHMLPVHILEHENPQLEVQRMELISQLVQDFSLKLLQILSEADVRGRIADDIDEGLYKIQLFELLAEESQCFYKYYSSVDAFTRRAYFSGRNIQPSQSLYDDTWGEIIMMSGLPGTGKDTWINANADDLPMISLDSIRRDLRIKPTDEQGVVIQTAQEQAKEFLRKRQPFIWNATDITKEIRQKYIALFERYNARVKIVYLETDWNTLLKRNAERENVVPESVIEKMLMKLSIPTYEEAQTVEWHCV